MVSLLNLFRIKFKHLIFLHCAIKEGHSSIQDSVAALELVILKANQYLSNRQQFEDEMMQIGLNHVNNVKLINGNSIVKYSYFEHLEHSINDSESKLYVNIFSNPLISQRPTWERDALGCREDSNVRTALRRFEVKITQPGHIVMVSLIHCILCNSAQLHFKISHRIRLIVLIGKKCFPI